VTASNAAAIATVTISSRAKVNWESSGGISTLLEVQAQGWIDFGRSMAAKTVAACKVYADATLLDPFGVVTYSTGVQYIGCKLGDASVDFGASRTVTVA
jgi:hypothetical protein